MLSDILGDEDHLGDMDFKVAGTSEGVTALQMDIKIEGITKEIMEIALKQARGARLHILKVMDEAVQAPRAQISDFAPRIHTIKINPEKIKDVIGKGGSVIRARPKRPAPTSSWMMTVPFASAVANEAAMEAIRRIEAITRRDRSEPHLRRQGRAPG